MALKKRSFKRKLTDKSIMKHFPKVELHRHLEGSFPIKTLHKIALKNKLDMPKDIKTFRERVQFPKDSKPDFLTFLAKFRNDWYKSHKDISNITYQSVKTFKKDGLFYIELRFSPEHFSFLNGFNRKEITELVISSANKAAEEDGIIIKYLLTFNRNKQSQEEMIDLYERLKPLRTENIVGIDLAGDEINFPPDLFQKFFDKVHADGLYKSTIHAGEVTSASQIWFAVRELKASRIGHGTTAIGDTNLQEFLKENEVTLELCITSNYQTGSWIDEKNHPVGELYRQGVPVTLNSDDPFIQGTDLTDDYIKAVKYFDFELDDLINLNLTALKASFTNSDAKEELIKKYNRKVEVFTESYL